MKHRRALAMLLGSSLLSTMLLGGLAIGVVTGATNVKIAGTHPSWANSTNFVAKADTTKAVGFKIYLGLADPTGAAALAKAVSDPKSASYGKYLSATQFRSKFGATSANASKVQNWLKAQGFSIDYTPENHHYVAAEGTLAQAAAAFGTTFNMYKIKGKVLRSPSGDLSVPASLAGIVTGAAGLDESYEFVTLDHVVDKSGAPPSAGFRNAPPLSTYWAEFMSGYSFPTGFTAIAGNVPYTVKGYTPAQIRSAYGVPSNLTGAGQTVAIIDAYASPTILLDVNQWSVNRGIAPMNPGQFKQVVAPGTYNRPNNKSQDPSGWYGEETLDVEAVHGMAPAANIVFVGAPNNYRDLDAALNHVVDRHLAQIVTNSYGFATELLPPGYVKPLEDTLIQAAIEGIGVYFSSGDEGDNTAAVGFATPSWPPASPWVTAVGGTSLGVDSSGARVLETGWGTSNYNCASGTCTRTGWLYGSGGGVSILFGKPSYQSGLSGSGRHIPDVAAFGDPQTGLLVGQTQSFPNGKYYDEYRIGGTSLSSPIFAGLMALLDQKSGFVHGFSNPLFYGHASAFYDVLSVKTGVVRVNFNNGVDASGGTADRFRTFDDYAGSPTQHTNAGWDNVTGLGTPKSAFFTLP